MSALAVFLLWCAALYRITLLRDDNRSPWRTSFAASIAAVTLGGTFHYWADSTSGIHAIPYTRCMAITSLVLGGACVTAFVDSLTYAQPRPGVARRHLCLAAVLSVLNVAWWFAARWQGRLDTLHPGLPVVMLYSESYSYLAVALLRVVGFCFREVYRTRHRPSHTVPLGLIGIACLHATAYALVSVLVLVSAAADHQRASELLGRSAAWIPYPALATLAAGILGLLVGPPLSRYLATVTTYWRLRPLWLGLTDSDPTLRLHIPWGRNPLTVLDLRTYRVVTEIYDALGMRMVDAAPAAGPKALAMALHQPPGGTIPATAVLTVPQDFQEERQQLLDLARHYRNPT